MKRILAIILCLAMLLICFVACGGSDDDDGKDTGDTGKTNLGNDDTTGEEVEVSTPYIEDRDFEGYVFTYLGGNSSSGILYDEDEIDKNSIADQAKIERDSEIVDRFNIKFDQIIYPDSSHINQYVLTDSMNPEASYDMGVPQTNEDISPFISQEVVMNIKEMPHINFSMPWYVQQANDEFTIMGRQYLMSGMYPRIPGTSPLVFNKDMMKDLNLELPYDTMLEGNWTLEEMNKYTSAAYVGDSSGNGTLGYEDRYGYSGHSRSIAYFYQGMGGITSSRDENGAVVPILSNDDVDARYTKLRELYDSPSTWINDQNNDGYPEGGHNVFRSGNSMFCYYVTVATKYYEIESFEYGIGILPKFDLSQTRYTVPGSGDMVLFPINLRDSEVTGYLYEAINEASYRITYPANIQEAAYFEKLPDEQSIEVQKLVDSSLTYDVLKNFDPSGGLLASCGFIYNCLQNNTNPSITAQQYTGVIDKMFSDFFYK